MFQPFPFTQVYAMDISQQKSSEIRTKNIDIKIKNMLLLKIWLLHLHL